MPKKASATNPGYTTLWAVVMPYSKDEPRYEDSKAWVRVFSVKETAEEVLKTIKPLTLIQGTGEAYIVDAELIDYTLPEELKCDVAQVCITLRSGPLFNSREDICRKTIHCEKYKGFVLSSKRIPRFEVSSDGTILMKFSSPITKDMDSLQSIIDGCINTFDSITKQYALNDFMTTYDIARKVDKAIKTEKSTQLIVVDPDGSGAFVFKSKADKDKWVKEDEYDIFKKGE